MSFSDEVCHDFRTGDPAGWYKPSFIGAGILLYCDSNGLYVPEIGTDYSSTGWSTAMQLDRGASAPVEQIRFVTNNYTTFTAYISDTTDYSSGLLIVPSAGYYTLSKRYFTLIWHVPDGQDICGAPGYCSALVYNTLVFLLQCKSTLGHDCADCETNYLGVDIEEAVETLIDLIA